MKIQYLNQLEAAKGELKLFPATPEEVYACEKKLGLKLPQAVKEFFLLTGKDYDLLLRGGGGTPQGLVSLAQIHATAIEILKKCEATIIPDFFPFLEYGDQFLFVYLSDGENPPVYRFETELFFCGEDYIPGSSSWGYPKGVSKIADSFSQMIDSVVQNSI